jgi:uncharacterized membrane protein (DUF2068 family)
MSEPLKQPRLALSMRAGDPPRTRLVLRLIAVERSLRGLILLAAGIYLLFHLSTDFGKLAERIMRSVELDPRQHFLHQIVARLHRLRAHQLRIVGIAAIGYGGLELVEGVGLWLDQLWAEYLTLIATSLLIPFELYELAIRPSLWKAGGILVNVLIIIYLAAALRRRLRRGGGNSRDRSGLSVSTPRACCASKRARD